MTLIPVRRLSLTHTAIVSKKRLFFKILFTWFVISGGTFKKRPNFLNMAIASRSIFPLLVHFIFSIILFSFFHLSLNTNTHFIPDRESFRPWKKIKSASKFLCSRVRSPRANWMGFYNWLIMWLILKNTSMICLTVVLYNHK